MENRPENIIIDCYQKTAVKTDNENLSYVFLDKNISDKTNFKFNISFANYIYLGVASLQMIKQQEFIHSNKFMDNVFLIKITSTMNRVDSIQIELTYDKSSQQINFLNKSIGRQSSLIIGNKKPEELRPCIVLVQTGDMVQI